MIKFNSVDEIRIRLCMMVFQPEYNEHLLDLNDEDIPDNTYRRQDVLLVRNLYQFIKVFVETKAGIIPPKSMVIQHFILDTMFNKCPFADVNQSLRVSIANFMNVTHRIEIDKKLNELPF